MQFAEDATDTGDVTGGHERYEVAGFFRRDLRLHLVGFDDQDGIAGADRSAWRDQPRDDGGFLHGETKFREADLGHVPTPRANHGSGPPPALLSVPPVLPGVG
jgi:hypothetical protein